MQVSMEYVEQVGNFQRSDYLASIGRILMFRNDTCP